MAVRFIGLIGFVEKLSQPN